jgi:predicted GIY-YIG superfamily endonuclease
MNYSYLFKHFDDNINNLVLDKKYIYTLLLEDNRYYIGRTANIFKRLSQHFTSKGSIYTKKFKPIKILEIVIEETCYDEKNKTIEYMKKYGWEKVRGSYWCSLSIKQPTILKKNEINNYNYNNFKYSNMSVFDNISKPWSDEDSCNLVRLYNDENKDIIEIGKVFNRTPGSIAAKLTQLKTINNRVNARGYNDYINSELYKEVCSFYRLNKKEKKERKDNKEIITNTTNSREENLEIKEMKLEIKEMKLEIIELKGIIKNLSHMLEAVYEFEN